MKTTHNITIKGVEFQVEVQNERITKVFTSDNLLPLLHGEGVLFFSEDTLNCYSLKEKIEEEIINQEQVTF